jgi:uncharacterized protein
MGGISHGSPLNDQTVLEPDVHYVCQRCNACCKWPGDVRIEDSDVVAISAFLGMSEADFIEKYTRLRVKPAQCAGFPNTWNFPGWHDVCKALPVPVNNL